MGFQGTPTGVGAVTGSLSGVQKTITTAGLSTASDIADALANAFNADATLIAQAVEVDPIDNTIYSDGSFGNFTSSDTGITAMPEPAGALGLAPARCCLQRSAGAAFAVSERAPVGIALGESDCIVSAAAARIGSVDLAAADRSSGGQARILLR